jgi:two-component system chemotaxis response regulator CheB
VQHPADAEFPDMPRNALDAVDVDHCVPLTGISALLSKLAREPVEESIDAVPRTMAHEVRMAQENRESMEALDGLGKRTSLTCPECGGALWELDDTGAQRFRCHVGHAYSIQTLASEQTVRVEAAIWAALRSLEENERLALRMAFEADRRGHAPLATSYGENAKSSAAHAEVLRGLLTSPTLQSAETTQQPAESGNIENRK